jgi:hypothetical protein
MRAKWPCTGLTSTSPEYGDDVRDLRYTTVSVCATVVAIKSF